MAMRTARVVSVLLGAVIVTGRAEPQTRPPLALAPIYEAYASGDVEVVGRMLRSLDSLQAIRTELFATMSLFAAEQADQPIPAAFLFEVATAGLEFGWPDAMTVLERGRIVAQHRRDAPGVNARSDAFELSFHRAAVSVLIGLQRSEAVESYLLRIDDRVAADPGTRERLIEPRFLLTHAMAQELRTRPVMTASARASAFPPRLTSAEVGAINAALLRFDVAARYPRNAAEAHVRKAQLLHRLGRFEDALASLASVGEETDDRYVSYWCALFRGRTLDALSRPADAEAAYRLASAVAPHAQSPAVALSALFARQDRLPEALEWANAARSAPAATIDPWWRYWFGDLRFLPQLIDELRKAGR